MATSSKSYLLKKHFDGVPSKDDFEIVETTLPAIAEGEFLVESLYLSVDPYIRIKAHLLELGSTMNCNGVGRVIESKNEDFAVGCCVSGPIGWRTHLIVDLKQAEALQKISDNVDAKDLSHFVGALGLTGLTAYFGLLDICKPQPGETVFVNAAAGAVGIIVGQIARIKGCHVVGCAGSEAKLQCLREIGFDKVFNYKNVDFDKTLTELCPDGIDCFFENVGGSMFDTTLMHMNQHGRIAVCGTISSYNNKEVAKGPYIHLQVIFKEIKIQGLLASSYKDKYGGAINELQTWMHEGKIKAREDFVDGFENMSAAFIGLFSGERIGKVVIKIK